MKGPMNDDRENREGLEMNASLPEAADELDVLVMTLFSKRRPKLPNPGTVKQGEERGYLANLNGRMVLTIHGEMRAKELFSRPLP